MSNEVNTCNYLIKMDIYSRWLLNIILLASVQHGVYSSPVLSCDLILSESSTALSDNDNYSVVCKSSCFDDEEDGGKLIWFDNDYNLVETTDSNRIYTIQYGRGRYSRLVIMNSMPEDAGSYICIREVGGIVKQKTFILNHTGVSVTLSDEDAGPRRGDIAVHDQSIPHRRPKRDATDQSTTIVPEDENSGFSTDSEVKKETDMMNDAMSAYGIFSEEPTSGPTSLQHTSTWNTVKSESQSTTEMETKTELKTDSKTETKTTNSRNQPKPNLQERTTTTAVPKTTGPNTEFGRIGLVAFVLTISAAFLLLYALLLILCIPRCLNRRKSVHVNRKRSENKKEIPNVLSLKKLQDNGQTSSGPNDNNELSSPGPSDAGFTTIDLDDQTDNHETQQEEKNHEQQQLLVKVDTQQTGSSCSAKVEEETPESQDSLLNSVLHVSGNNSNNGDNNSGIQDNIVESEADLLFIDQSSNKEIQCETLESPTNPAMPSNATPDVIDEPPRSVTETTEVKLEITEKADGQKRITLSTSASPPPSPEMHSMSSLSSDSPENV